MGFLLKEEFTNMEMKRLKALRSEEETTTTNDACTSAIVKSYGIEQQKFCFCSFI